MAAYARLFGRPLLRVDGHRFAPPPGKDAALLVYLAWRGGWTERGRLAGLAWGDRPEEIARRNLRQAQFRLRRGPWASLLEVEPRRVRAVTDSDVAACRNAVRRQAWDDALRLRVGPFLDDWSLDDLPELDVWSDEVRSELDRLWRRALEARSRELEGAGDLLEAATVAEVADAIGRDRALLVLDNVEHQLEAVRDAVTILLERCPRLTILTTSRAVLGLQAEHPVPLAGLSHRPGDGGDHDAARLFLTAARRRRPDLAIDDRSHVVQELCRDVGGLPLALELLASWSDVLAPDAMLAELRRGLDVLSSTSPDLPERHRALRAVLAASHEQLGADGREAFARLAPFRGGFDLAAAREVGVTPRGLQQLVRAMLVQREGQRFAHHPLVRRFALEQAHADPAAYAELRRRHAHVYLGRLSELTPALLRQSGLGSARRTYLDDGPNLREALLWASEHADLATFVRRHQTFVILEWTFVRRHDAAFAEEAFQHASEAVRPHLRQVLPHVGLDASDRSIAGPSRASLEREARSLVAEARARGDGLLASRALRSLARSRLRAHDAGAAERHAQEAVRAVRRDAARWGWVARGAAAYGFRARSAARAAAGRYGPARRDLLGGIALFRHIGDPGLPELSRLLQLDVAFGRYARAARVADAVDACLPEEAPATPPCRTPVARTSRCDADEATRRSPRRAGPWRPSAIVAASASWPGTRGPSRSSRCPTPASRTRRSLGRGRTSRGRSGPRVRPSCCAPPCRSCARPRRTTRREPRGWRGRSRAIRARTERPGGCSATWTLGSGRKDRAPRWRSRRSSTAPRPRCRACRPMCPRPRARSAEGRARQHGRAGRSRALSRRRPRRSRRPRRAPCRPRRRPRSCPRCRHRA